MGCSVPVRFRDFGCESPIVSLDDGDVVVSTSVSNTQSDLQVSRHFNKSHIEPWVTLPSPESTAEIHFFTVWKSYAIVGEIILWGFSTGSCFISYWIDRNYTNKGIGARAVFLTLKHCFDVLNLDQVFAAIQLENIPSARLAEKVGFEKTNATTLDFVEVQGKKVPHAIWSIKAP